MLVLFTFIWNGYMGSKMENGNYVQNIQGFSVCILTGKLESRKNTFSLTVSDAMEMTQDPFLSFI